MRSRRANLVVVLFVVLFLQNLGFKYCLNCEDEFKNIMKTGNHEVNKASSPLFPRSLCCYRQICVVLVILGYQNEKAKSLYE